VPTRDIPSNTGTTISTSEGNMTERVPISSVAPALHLDLVYNSYNAGARARRWMLLWATAGRTPPMCFCSVRPACFVTVAS
jgi:hypothetical protein